MLYFKFNIITAFLILIGNNYVANSLFFPPPMAEFNQLHVKICSHCFCDVHSATVTCLGQHLYIQTINLPKFVETLHIHNVSLKHLPHFTYNTNLRVLRINGCGLEHVHALSLISLPNLEVLDFSDNALTGLPETFLHPLHKIRILNLARNKISDISELEGITTHDTILQDLVLNGNPLSFVTTTNQDYGPPTFPVTHQLHLANINLESLNSTYLILKASATCITEHCRAIPLSYEQWALLRSLDLSETNIKLDASALTYMTNISSLNLQKVKLPNAFLTWINDKSQAKHIDIQSAVFEENVQEWEYCSEKLEYLDISNLKLTEINLQSHCKIHFLYAQNNRIFNVKINYPSLKKLYLDNNALMDFPEPSIGVAFDQLETLSVSQNHIRKLNAKALHTFSNLNFLDISRNDIYYIDPDAFPSVGLSLQFLNVSHNKLSSFVHPILPRLSILDLSYNRIVSLDPQLFAGLPALQHLNLNHNTEIDMQCRLSPKQCWLDSLSLLTSLVELHMVGTSLTHIPNLTFFTNLKVIDLSGNKLKVGDLTRLPICASHLDLSSNLIHSMTPISPQQKECLHDLNLAYNPLECQCNLEQLSTLLSSDPLFTDQNAYYCFSSKWQYPLSTFLTSAKGCDNSSSFAILSSLKYFIGSLFIFTILSTIFLFLVFKTYSIVRSFNFVPFSYKPVSTVDAPFDL